MEESNRQKIIRLLAMARKRSGVPQWEVAASLHVTVKTISAWEKGRIEDIGKYVLFYRNHFINALCDMRLKEETMNLICSYADAYQNYLEAKMKIIELDTLFEEED